MATSVLLFLLLFLSPLLASAKSTLIRGLCPGKIPPRALPGSSCGIPDFVNSTIFGDNADTTGTLHARPHPRGVDLTITLNNLPKPDLVLTAWLIWTPFGDVEPPIFKVANHASPCASYTAKFGTGLSRDPNVLTYVSPTKATLKIRLNFNPTYPGEGPLTRESFCFQKDIPGIKGTRLQQFPASDGKYVPLSSSYLRMYDPHTGFEVLGRNGRPMIARSPVKAMGVEVIAHVDKTTHGISQGVGGTDHYFLIFFPFDKAIGKRTVSRMV